MTKNFLQSVLSLMAVVLVSVNGNAANFENNICFSNSKISNEAEILAPIKIRIEVGRVSKGCSGFGFCDFSIGADFGLIEIEIVKADKVQMTASVSESNQKTI